MKDITITLTDPSTTQTESIEINPSETTVKSLIDLGCALLDIDITGNNSSADLYKNGAKVFSSSKQDPTLNDVGIVHGDVLAILRSAPAASQLDFSAILSDSPLNTTTTNSAAAAAGSSMDFSNLINAHMSQTGAVSSHSNNTQHVDSAPIKVVEWAGMTLDDAMHSNPNPRAFCTLLFRNETLMKQLNFHMPPLAKKLQECRGDLNRASKLYQETIVKGSIANAVNRTSTLNEEEQMRKRLSENSNDVIANEYFEKKLKDRQILEQYRKMMDEYPESMGRVLMLYIECELNGHKFQAFVDSGAQMTIMSRKFAEKVGLLDYVDKRFSGVAVGVGTGKILGKIHIAELTIKGHIFPCTITVMDDEGLGNKDMDFILGLDMLKRHRCKIDLLTNNLVFTASSNGNEMTFIEAPFLHEKDLDESKGGTQGFDVKRANEEIERMMMETEKNDDSMDTDKEMTDSKVESKR